MQEFDAELSKVNGKYSKFTDAQKQALRLIAEQINQQQQLNAVQAFSVDNKRALEDYAFEIGLIGQTSKEIERLRFERELDNKAKELSVGMSAEVAAKLWEEVAAIKSKREELARLKELSGQDWFAGIEDGMRKFISNTGSVRDQFTNVTESALGSVADGLSNLFTGAKVSFRDMARSILAELAKIYIRMAIMNLVSSVAGSMSGSSSNLNVNSSWSGGQSMGVSAFMTKADGGYISGPGTGRSDSIPAWLSNGEFVVNAQATAENRELLEAMNNNRFADGGYVGAPAPARQPAGAGNTTNISVSVTVDGGDGGTEEEARKGVEAGMRAAMQMIAQSEIASSWRPGNLSYQMAKSV